MGSELGDRVKELREKLNMSRAKVAHEANVSYAFVQQLETGVRRDPSAANLGKVALVLGVTVDSLLHGGMSVRAADPPEETRSPARAEIDALLDSLSSDELSSARDLLRMWTGKPASAVSATRADD